MTILSLILVAALLMVVIAIVLLVIQLSKKTRTNEELKESLSKYKDIINVDSEVSKRKAALETLGSKLSELEKVYKNKDSALNQDYLQHKAIYENLRKEVSLLEENLENISYGLYKPHYDYKTSEEFKQNLEKIIDRQRQEIKNETATYCSGNWEVRGSKTEGAKMTKHYSKLMLRAFNGECDAAIAKVRWNNIDNMEARIGKAFEAINKLGSTLQITVTKEYFDLKLQELQLEFELEEKDRGNVEIGGFSVDAQGNILMTVPVLFRAFMLAPDGTMNWFGKPSGAPGGFNITAGIVRDSKGNFLVVDRLKGSLLVFDRKFAFVTQFATRGYKPGQLAFPDDLAIDGHDRVYVTQMARRGVSVFKLTYL